MLGIDLAGGAVISCCSFVAFTIAGPYSLYGRRGNAIPPSPTARSTGRRRETTTPRDACTAGARGHRLDARHALSLRGIRGGPARPQPSVRPEVRIRPDEGQTDPPRRRTLAWVRSPRRAGSCRGRSRLRRIPARIAERRRRCDPPNASWKASAPSAAPTAARG